MKVVYCISKELRQSENEHTVMHSESQQMNDEFNIHCNSPFDKRFKTFWYCSRHYIANCLYPIVLAQPSSRLKHTPMLSVGSSHLYAEKGRSYLKWFMRQFDVICILRKVWIRQKRVSMTYRNSCRIIIGECASFVFWRRRKKRNSCKYFQPKCNSSIVWKWNKKNSCTEEREREREKLNSKDGILWECIKVG